MTQKRKKSSAPKKGKRALRFQKSARSGPSEASLKDPVTELYNRSHLLRRLQETMARVDRSKETMIVILWDIDGFKKFNNEHGQKEGDKFLKKVGASIRRSLRVYDEAFRAGPDEFCAILSPADESASEEIMKRVAQIVSNELFEGDAEYSGEKFSISSGVAIYPGPVSVPEGLLHAASQELYRSRLAKVAN